MRTMTLAVALVLGVSCGAAAAEEEKDPITAEIEEAMARQKAKNDLAQARYGAPIETKSGAVEGSAHLLALLRRQMPATTAAIGADLAKALPAQDTCSGPIVLADGDVPLARLTLAQSNFETLRFLQVAIDNHGKQPPPGPQILGGILPALSLLGGVSSVLKLFQSDYKVETSAMSADMDWVAAAMLQAGNTGKTEARVISERFPSLANVKKVAESFTALQQSARGTKDKDLIAAVDAFIASATKGGNDAPIAAMAQYLPLQPDPNNYCLALVNVSISPLAIARQSAFGGQGKAYLRADVIGTMALVNASGSNPTLTCRRRTLHGAVDLKDLTKGGAVPPLENELGVDQDGNSSQSINCG